MIRALADLRTDQGRGADIEGMRFDLKNPVLHDGNGDRVELYGLDGSRRDLRMDGTSKLEDWDGTRVDRDMEGHPIEGFDYDAWFSGQL